MAATGAFAQSGQGSPGAAPNGTAANGPSLDPHNPSGLLPKDHFTIKSALQIDLSHQSVRLRIHKGYADGVPVWYVITDASDRNVADKLGVNFAPKLANLLNGQCPGCVQEINPVSGTGSDGVTLGPGLVKFQGAPIFGVNIDVREEKDQDTPRNLSLDRALVPGPMGFPPLSFSPGAIGDMHYSPFVHFKRQTVVFNAPIVAVGEGPFDVAYHRNTHDRMLRMNKAAGWADFVFITGFSNGKVIMYLSLESSDALTSVLERSTFVPALGLSSFPNGDFEPGPQTGSARSSIFAFANGDPTLQSPPGQGENHLILTGGITEEANFDHPDVLEKLRLGGDAHNVLSNFPTLSDPTLAEDYSPLWDLRIGFYSPAAIQKHLNKTARTDANEILNLAAQGLITAQGGRPLRSSGIVINCPVIGFLNEKPLTEPVPNHPQPPDVSSVEP